VTIKARNVISCKSCMICVLFVLLSFQHSCHVLFPWVVLLTHVLSTQLSCIVSMSRLIDSCPFNRAVMYCFHESSYWLMSFQHSCHVLFPWVVLLTHVLSTQLSCIVSTSRLIDSCPFNTAVMYCFHESSYWLLYSARRVVHRTLFLTCSEQMSK